MHKRKTKFWKILHLAWVALFYNGFQTLCYFQWIFIEQYQLGKTQWFRIMLTFFNATVAHGFEMLTSPLSGTLQIIITKPFCMC